MALIEEAFLLTKSSVERYRAMVAALAKVKDVPGDIVECGVWQGGNMILARALSPHKVCWLYDTFEGMPEPDHELDFKAGSGALAIRTYEAKGGAGMWAKVSLEQVEANFAKFKLLDYKWLRFVKGRVETTLRNPDNVPEQVALLRLDTDWHASTKAELEVLYPKLSPGGVLIIDDYGHWAGCRKAVDDYFADARPDFVQVDYTCVMAVKPC